MAFNQVSVVVLLVALIIGYMYIENEREQRKHEKSIHEKELKRKQLDNEKLQEEKELANIKLENENKNRIHEIKKQENELSMKRLADEREKNELEKLQKESELAKIQLEKENENHEHEKWKLEKELEIRRFDDQKQIREFEKLQMENELEKERLQADKELKINLAKSELEKQNRAFEHKERMESERLRAEIQKQEMGLYGRHLDIVEAQVRQAHSACQKLLEQRSGYKVTLLGFLSFDIPQNVDRHAIERCLELQRQALSLSANIPAIGFQQANQRNRIGP